MSITGHCQKHISCKELSYTGNAQSTYFGAPSRLILATDTSIGSSLSRIGEHWATAIAIFARDGFLLGRRQSDCHKQEPIICLRLRKTWGVVLRTGRTCQAAHRTVTSIELRECGRRRRSCRTALKNPPRAHQHRTETECATSYSLPPSSSPFMRRACHPLLHQPPACRWSRRKGGWLQRTVPPCSSERGGCCVAVKIKRHRPPMGPADGAAPLSCSVIWRTVKTQFAMGGNWPIDMRTSDRW